MEEENKFIISVIIIGVFFLALFIFMIALGSPDFIIYGIIGGVGVLLLILAGIIDYFFPDNKISKRFEKLVERIEDFLT